MSTNATIAVKQSDGSYLQSYVHWDGDTSYTGRLLRTYYTTQEIVERLVNLGNLSSVGAEIGTKHPFDMRDHDMCTAYGRDRGERDQDSLYFGSFSELCLDGMQEEYNYFFIDGEWFVCPGTIIKERFVPLTGSEVNV